MDESPRVTGDWLTVQQAAAEMGVSPATVRRMVKSGELEAEVLPRRGGQTSFRVRRRQPESDPNQPASEPPDSTFDAGAALVEYAGVITRMVEYHKGQADRIAELERENGRLAAEAARVGKLDEEAQRLTEIAADLTERLTAEGERLQVAEAERDEWKRRAERPWWRRLFDPG